MKGMNCNEKYILHIENSRAEPVIWENLGKYGGTDMLGTYKIRTDLAVEARERFTENNVEVRGVEAVSYTHLWMNVWRKSGLEFW